MEVRIVLWFMLLVGSRSVFANLEEDKETLINFIVSIKHANILNWYTYTSVCETWAGVTCNSDGSRVIALQLPSIGLNGVIPPNTLGRLSALQLLSLQSNSLSGPFPDDITSLSSLTELHLQSNSLSGPLPSDYSPWRNLKILDLSFNSFNGSIPSSISDLSQLNSLNLSNNLLSGELPDLNLPQLQFLNLSNNHLEGVVPSSLKFFPSSSFSGNHLKVESPPPPIGHPTLPPPPLIGNSKSSNTPRKNLSEPLILGLIVGGSAIAFAAITMSVLLCCLWRKDKRMVSGKLTTKGGKFPEKMVPENQDENNRLVFFDSCTVTFDLEDLLRASAEVLGKGTFGMAYKAILEDSTTVVVKRLKDISVGKREFEQQMGLVGRIRHENLVELRAYYYSKDEKLMVYDFYSVGNVSSLLHGHIPAKRGEDRIPLDWETRLRIALGAARGIARIHSESGAKLVHGNIKSSNIFLNCHFYGCISDLGISTLTNHMAPPTSRLAGYRAPEVVELRKATQMSDVYSFGVVLLEILTGKSPVHVVGSGDDIVHLVRWVQSVVREEWTAEVFDVELMKYPNIEEEMVELLQIAMNCVERVPERRPKISEVVKLISDIRRLDTENWPSSDTRSDESSVFVPPLEEGSTSEPV